MGIIGVLWIIFVVLKVLGLIATSWLWVILWPIPVILLIWLVIVVFGVTIAGFSTLRR